MRWLSPSDIQENYSFKKSITYTLLKEYEEAGGEVIRVGKLRRVPEEGFTEFLKTRKFRPYGVTNDPLYFVYSAMIQRCNCPTHTAYHNYGGRGITVCDEWQHNPTAFIKWARVNGYQHGLSLDRIDNNKGYSPDNCRWATVKVQNNNRRDNCLITANGECHTMSEWANLLGTSRNVIWNRIHKLGWSEEKAVSTPLMLKREV
jgi:hypothetical protein